jgi:Tol biopolymer transport system component
MGDRARRGGPALLAAAAAGVLLALPAAGAGSAPTERVSVATGGGQAKGNSIAPAMSKDGRYVAFYSNAANLVAGDTNRARDVFVHDRQTGETTRVSVANDGSQANGESFAPAINGDGRYVVFSSSASNLVAGDQNNADDIFLRDRVANTTTRVSIGLGGAEPNAGSFNPAISADGNVVAYESDATNLVPGDTNGLRDVFVYDRASGTTTRVSVSTAGDEADAPSGQPALDANGGIVAYSSFADNLITLDENFTADVFVYDRAAHTTTRVSVYTGDFEADGNSFHPSLSADGRFVAYDSDSFNLAWYDPDEGFDVYIWDRQAGVISNVSVDDAGNLGDDTSSWPSISSDGRYVAYQTEATDIVPGDQNGVGDIVLYDRQSGAVDRISLTNSGDESDNESVRPSISGDGKLVAYQSLASNLVPGDGNRFNDIFVRDTTLNPPPAARCVVPKVVGLKLAAAKKRIVRGNCRLGKVKRVHVRAKRKVGRVIAQSPRARTRHAAGTRVNLSVGRR